MAALAPRLKIIVLDDDPTGSQAVHSCPLLLRWDGASLAAGLDHPSPLLFLLANTRALAPEDAGDRVRAICRALAPALQAARERGTVENWLLVSRGDSTLRGHFPLEAEVVAAELGPFDATLLVPAFLEGGRTTAEGVHRLHGRPVHETPFARDGLFGYSTSHLPDWVEEKSDGRIPSAVVERVSLAELEAVAPEGSEGSEERAGPQALLERLRGFSGNPVVVVDAEQPHHLEALAAACATACSRDGSGVRSKRLLVQSAASFLKALAALPPPPLGQAALAVLRRRDRDRGGPLPGLILVGSHVPLADEQLAALLAESGCGGVELEVGRVRQMLAAGEAGAGLEALEGDLLHRLRGVWGSGRTPVLFTSRGEVACENAVERRRLGQALARLMARIGAALASEAGYLISKGGITSHMLLEQGLELAEVELQGQLLPGLSVVLTPAEAAGPGRLPVLTFPGNLGDSSTLMRAWQLMEGTSS